jgi:hypothetical protein
MANHSLTSNTAVVTGTSGVAGTFAFTIIYPALKQSALGGVIMYVQMAGTSGLTLTPSVINSQIGTAAFGLQGTSGLIGEAGTAGIASLVIAAGTANYRIVLPLIPNERSLIVNAVFGAGSNGVAVVDFSGEGDRT